MRDYDIAGDQACFAASREIVHAAVRKSAMQAMVLPAPGAAMTMQERPDPAPGVGEVRVKVSACGVCRTDLHVVDGELPDIGYPIVPGHEVVGRIDAVGTKDRKSTRLNSSHLGMSY